MIAVYYAENAHGADKVIVMTVNGFTADVVKKDIIKAKEAWPTSEVVVLEKEEEINRFWMD